MTSIRTIAAAWLLLGASALLTEAAATPGAQMKELEDMAAEAGVGSAVVNVAGCHRHPKKHWVYRWGRHAQHFHVGRNCAPRRYRAYRRHRAYPPYRGYRPYRGRGRPPGLRRRGCLQAGPIWYCP